MTRPISADERRWRAEDDARTLAESEKIKNDPSRVKDAQAAAQRMLEEEKERLLGLQKVAGKKTTSSMARQQGKTETAKRSTVSATGPWNVFNKI